MVPAAVREGRAATLDYLHADYTSLLLVWQTCREGCDGSWTGAWGTRQSAALSVDSASDRHLNRSTLSDFRQLDGGLLRRQRNIALFAVLQCLDDALAFEGKRKSEVLSYHGV
jgi:hypothetical protein